MPERTTTCSVVALLTTGIDLTRDQMSIEADSGEGFFDRYNIELERLSCGARICAPASRDQEMMSIVDLDGKAIADLPRSIGPRSLAAVMLLIEQAFEEGFQAGQALGD